MGIYKAEIANMRRNLGANEGQKIMIKEIAGRKNIEEEKSATIEKVYNSYFIIKYDSNERLGTFNYTDLFMKSVELKMFDGNDYVPLDIPDVSDRKNKLHKLTPAEIKAEMTNSPEPAIDMPFEIA